MPNLSVADLKTALQAIQDARGGGRFPGVAFKGVIDYLDGLNEIDVDQISRSPKSVSAPKKSASAGADANIVSRYVTLLGNAETVSAGNAIVDQLAKAKGVRVVELIAIMKALTGAAVKQPKPTLLANLRTYVRNSRHDKGYTPGAIK